MGDFRRDVVSGLVVVGPLAITLLGILYVLRMVSGLPLVGRIEPWYIRAPTVIGIFVVVVMATGYLMRTTFGTIVQDIITGAINHIPLLRVVFNATRLGIQTALRQEEQGTRPVKVEIWSGHRVTAFDTGNRAADGRHLCFFPTSPNITTGYVIEVEEDRIEQTNERIESALIRLISAGFSDGNDNERPAPEGGVVEYVHNVELPGNR